MVPCPGSARFKPGSMKPQNAGTKWAWCACQNLSHFTQLYLCAISSSSLCIFMYSLILTEVSTSACVRCLNLLCNDVGIFQSCLLAHLKKCCWHETLLLCMFSPNTLPMPILFAPFSSVMKPEGCHTKSGLPLCSQSMSLKVLKKVVTWIHSIFTFHLYDSQPEESNCDWTIYPHC